MVKVTFLSSRGESIEMGLSSFFKLTNYSGFMSNDVTTQLAKGFKQQGKYYYGTNENERILNITCKYKFQTIKEGKQIRKTLSRVFNPNLGTGRITYEDDIGKYIIDAVVSVKPEVYEIDTEGIYLANSFDVILTCPKPDWLSYETYSLKMNALIGGRTYPLQLPSPFAETGAGMEINYSGDNPADIVFDFRVAEGGESMSNPKVTNAKGEYIEISKTLYPNEKILVDTNPDAPSIVFIDSNGAVSDAWNSRVEGSTFFQLEHGTNIFSFNASAGDPEVYAEYKEHFSGV